MKNLEQCREGQYGRGGWSLVRASPGGCTDMALSFLSFARREKEFILKREEVVPCRWLTGEGIGKEGKKM